MSVGQEKRWFLVAILDPAWAKNLCKLRNDSQFNLWLTLIRYNSSHVSSYQSSISFASLGLRDNTGRAESAVISMPGH